MRERQGFNSSKSGWSRELNNVPKKSQRTRREKKQEMEMKKLKRKLKRKKKEKIKLSGVLFSRSDFDIEEIGFVQSV